MPQYGVGFDDQKDNYGRLKSELAESDATTHAINDLCHELRKMRHEQKKMRREHKKMRHMQEKKVRYAEAETARCLMNLLMRQSINRAGAFDCDCFSMLLGLEPSRQRKKKKNYSFLDCV